MTIDKVQSACRAEPFQPFLLHLADGREIPVKHREFIAMAPAGRTLVVFQPDGSLNIVDLPLVKELEFKPSGNGGKRRK